MTNKAQLPSEEVDIFYKIRHNHSVILLLIQDITNNIHYFQQAKPLIQKLQDVLYDHFRYQSEEFFKKVKSLSKSDLKRFKQIQWLESDLIQCKIDSLAFFEKHPCDMSDTSAKNIVGDFSQLAAKIVDRLRIENEILK